MIQCHPDHGSELVQVAGCLVIIAFQYHPFDAVQRIEYKIGIHLRLQGRQFRLSQLFVDVNEFLLFYRQRFSDSSCFSLLPMRVAMVVSILISRSVK